MTLYLIGSDGQPVSSKLGFSLVYDYAKREIHISDPQGKHVCHGDTDPERMGECNGFPFPQPKSIRKKK